LALPYTAKVVQNGKTRAMGAAQTSGDCNACHTPTGANGAPGRVTIPIP
jgi:mono/diheme cytochrome c family protein